MKLFHCALVAAAFAIPAAALAQCPAFGLNTDCGVLITALPGGTYSVTDNAGQGPYDGTDDTLVGFLNTTTATITSVVLSNPGVDIFGFDGDGIDTYGAPSNAMDTTGYGGPATYFTGIDAAEDMGTANFIGGVAPGGFTYFSLEEDLTGASGGNPITVGGGTPEPSSLILLGTGIIGMAGAARRRFIK